MKLLHWMYRIELLGLWGRADGINSFYMEEEEVSGQFFEKKGTRRGDEIQ